MKKTNFSTLTIMLIILTLVCLMGVSGIFAKYTTTLTGSGQAKIAKWAFSAKNGENSLSETFTITLDDQTSNDFIQPGSTGKIAITIDNSGSDVAANLTVTAKATTENAVLNSDQFTIGTPVKAGTTDQTVTKVEAGETVNIEIPWTWNYVVGEGTTDSADRTVGAASTGALVPVIDLVVTGTQVEL